MPLVATWGCAASNGAAKNPKVIHQEASPLVKPEYVDEARLDRFVIVRASRKSIWGTGDEQVRDLYNFADSPRCGPLDPSHDGGKLSCLQSEYAVDKDADIIIDFDERIKDHYQGLINIRARLLKKHPVELSVENYTIVSDDRLQQNLVVNVRNPEQLFRDDAFRADFLTAITTLEAHLLEYNGQLTRLDAVLTRLERGEALDPSALALTLAELNTLQQLLDDRRPSIITTLNRLKRLIERRFLTAEFTDALDQESFLAIRERGLSLLKQITRASVGLSADFAPLARGVGGCITDPASQDGGPCDALNDLRGLLTRNRDDLMLASKGDLADVALTRHMITQTDAMTAVAARGMATELAERVRPARIKLGASGIEHGDIIEIIITSSEAPLTLRNKTVQLAGDKVEVFDMRFRLRAVSLGFSQRVAASFVLIQRFEDVEEGSTTDIPSNFKPTAGGALMFRYRTLGRWSNWLLPSFGFLVTAPDFDPRQTFEVGLGPNLGVLNESMHLGIGWNVSVDQKREYFYVGLDFLQTVENFGALFGQ